jgi:hypothetical protein
LLSPKDYQQAYSCLVGASYLCKFMLIVAKQVTDSEHGVSASQHEVGGVAHRGEEKTGLGFVASARVLVGIGALLAVWSNLRVH